MSEKSRDNKVKNKIIYNNFLNKIESKIRQIICLDFSIRNVLFMRKLPNMPRTQVLMKQLLTQEKPFVVVRFGLYEYMVCYQYLEKRYGIRMKYSDFIRQHISMDAGLFRNDDITLDEYSEYIINNLNQVDILAYWRNIPYTGVFAQFYTEGMQHININNLYPYPFWHKKNLPDWQLILSGKRVLVISSFAQTIKRQYEKRQYLWKNSKLILPDFELITYQSVVTNGGRVDPRFKNWHEALDLMLNDILKLDFDIALISCGVYGMPLALELKKKGYKSIQWGGCFQLWFGIIGGRWHEDKDILKYVNCNWTYPLSEETPPLADQVNNSCYWKPLR